MLRPELDEHAWPVRLAEHPGQAVGDPGGEPGEDLVASSRASARSLMPNSTIGGGVSMIRPAIPHRPAGTATSTTTAWSRTHSP